MKNMTLEDTYVEFLSKINIVNEFDAFTEEEMKKIIREKVKELVIQLYNLDIKKVAYLSERDTYVIRKMYGVLDNGECQTGVNLKEYAGVTNVAAIKMHYFQKMNKGIKKFIINYNLKKKKEIVLNRLGIKDSKYLYLNACIGLYEDDIWLDEYYLEHSIDEILDRIKDYKVFFTCADDFDKITLKNHGKEILKLRFGLEGKKGKTRKEVGKVFNVTGERIRQIETKSIEIVRRNFNFRDNMQYLSGPINEQYFLKFTCRILNNIGINTIEELNKVSEEELIIKLEDAVICDLEKMLKEKKSNNMNENIMQRLSRKMVLTRLLTILKDINRVRKVDVDKARENIEKYIKLLKI